MCLCACLSDCFLELVVLGAVQHGIVLLAHEERASESSGLRGPRSAFLPKVPIHCTTVLYCITSLVRSVHFLTLCVCCAGRQHKDVALVNMANILHRAHFSADAAILAHAALDLTSDLFTSHYTLGNIYAVSCKETVQPQWFLMCLNQKLSKR